MDHLLFAASEGSSVLQYLGSAGALLLGIMGLGLVIFVHELGHFLVAKACGVRCDKFYVGFDVPITIGPWTISSLWKKQWGETEYGIGTIPLGGYVKMLGQDDNPNNSEEESASTMVETVDEEGHKKMVVDPRSYTAKSVPQRMAIISAGVIFNLIFGVIFAAAAYNLGVPYTPTIVSYTQPGSPAWEAGISPGDQIVGINEEGEVRKHLRFRRDMQMQIVFNGSKKEMPFVVQHPDGEQQIYWLKPQASAEDGIHPTIGVAAMHDLTKMMVAPELMTELYGKEIADKMMPGDALVAIDGTPMKSYLDYEKYLANHPYDTLNMTFERKLEADGETEKTENVEIALPPVHVRETGLVMEMSPILGVRKGSPAEKAGIEVGDVLVSINGEPIGNGFTLPSRETKWAGQTVDVVVRRKDGEKTFSVETDVPLGFAAGYYPGTQMGLETLGVSYDLTNTVAEVLPNSSAEEQEIKPGDKILVVDFKGNSDAAQKWNTKRKIGKKPVNVETKGIAWQAVQMTIQTAAPDTNLVMTVRKKGHDDAAVAQVTFKPSETEVIPTRFLRFAAQQEIQTAENPGEALYLGLREVGEGMSQVVMVLKKIGSGEMQISSLGGPGTILYVATAESSRGLSRLLTFLTLISANLAVVNFLPIPVLDGGHMMFLLYEGVRGKPINEKWMMRLTYVGLAMVLTLMVTVIGLDIQRFFPWG